MTVSVPAIGVQGAGAARPSGPRTRSQSRTRAPQEGQNRGVAAIAEATGSAVAKSLVVHLDPRLPPDGPSYIGARPHQPGSSARPRQAPLVWFLRRIEAGKIGNLDPEEVWLQHVI